MHTKQLIADFESLIFLGAIASVAGCIGLSLIGLLIGRKGNDSSRLGIGRWIFSGSGLAGKAILAACAIVIVYGIAVVATSAAGQTYALTPGQEKYFCEIDCHIAYAVTDVNATQTIGENATSATGEFVIVTLRTRFDEKTISPTRPDAPLAPTPREVSLVDGKGNVYLPSVAGNFALAAHSAAGKSMLTPLRPGESYETKIAFDVPAGTMGLRLLIESPAQPRWVGWFAIGDEQSLLHKKVYLQLPA